jgi:DNA-binding transcriptional LysR family regulator
VTRAAQQLHVSSSAISLHLRDLERACGLALFERVRRRLQLTPAGGALQDYARRIFALSAEADAVLEQMRDLKAGTLRLGATDTPARSWVPRVLAAFRRAYPGIRVELYVGNTQHVIARLTNREDDVAIVAATIQHAQLVVEPVGFDPVVVIVSRQHSWSRRATIRLRDLHGEPLIVREPGSSTRLLVESQLESQSIRPEVVMELGSHDAIIGAVEHGVGIALVPASLVRPLGGAPARQGSLRVIRVRDAWLRHTVSIVYHVERDRFPLNRRFIEVARRLRTDQHVKR